jgi:hypothetical protein
LLVSAFVEIDATDPDREQSAMSWALVVAVVLSENTGGQGEGWSVLLGA